MLFTGLKLSRSVVIAFMFGYQMLILVYQFQGVLELYYFHLSLILTVILLTLAVNQASALTGWKDHAHLVLLAIVLAVSLLSCGYLYLNVEDIELRQPFLESADLYAGVAVVACVVFLTQRIWGTVLAALIALASGYFFLGNYFPGNFRFDPPDTEIIISYLAGMGGARGVIWGIPLSANTLFLIIVFGGLLKGTRILELFNETGRLLLNISRGGVCYSAILGHRFAAGVCLCAVPGIQTELSRALGRAGLWCDLRLFSGTDIGRYRAYLFFPGTPFRINAEK